MAVLEYNCTENDVTKETPYFLVFGKEPRTPLEVVMNIKPAEAAETSKHWREDFLLTLHQGLKRAAEKIQEQQQKNALRWLSKARERIFKPGDMVMIRKHPKTDASKGIHKKMSHRWKGPYPILQTPDLIKNAYYVEITTVHSHRVVTIIDSLLPQNLESCTTIKKPPSHSVNPQPFLL